MTSMTSGMGLATHVTLHVYSHIMGQEMVFPLAATHLDWVRGLAGAPFLTSLMQGNSHGIYYKCISDKTVSNRTK